MAKNRQKDGIYNTNNYNKIMHKIWREARLISKGEIGSNFRTWGADVNERYLAGPWKQGDNLDKIGGAGMAGLSVITEAPDQFFAGIAGKKLTPAFGLVGRTRRDLGELLG